MITPEMLRSKSQMLRSHSAYDVAAALSPHRSRSAREERETAGNGPDDPRWLFEAAGMGENCEEFKEKLEKGTDAQVSYRDHAGCTVLFEMCLWHNWPELAAAVIDRGCDVNAQNIFGMTALIATCADNHADAARVLLERGADRTIKLSDGDFAGTTAADAARRNDHDELAAAIDNFKPGKCLIA